jgi:hypothetical protein
MLRGSGDTQQTIMLQQLVQFLEMDDGYLRRSAKNLDNLFP